MSTLRRPGPGWWDLMPALPLLGIGLLGTSRLGEFAEAGSRRPDALTFVLVAVAALVLLFRRRAPIATLVGCGLAMSAYLLLDNPFGPILLTGPAAVYAVGTGLRWRSAIPWGLGFATVTAAAAGPGHVRDNGWVPYLIWSLVWFATLAGPAAIGAALQVRRRAEAGVRAEQARRAVSEEQLAMARDMHDGVGHGLAVIAMHAGVALHVLDRDPERARELLTSIQATSRESLDALRVDLDRLRSRGEPVTDGAAARRPAPGLSDLPVLLARMRDGGLPLDADITGVDGLPAEVGAAAYRIVQESLTNVLRHAGATRAEVRVARDGDDLVVEVRDHGRGVGLGGPSVTVVPDGSGIAGMRQRATAVGGRLEAGPAPGGGFLVRADLPSRAGVPSPGGPPRDGVPR